MAALVPFVVANTAAGAAIAGAVGMTATTLATVAAVAFQVTGINDKINKAASKVFGEDLVKIANIAGIAYGAYNGGFSLEPAKSFLGIGEAASTGANVVDSVAGLNSVPELTDASWLAEGAANTEAITQAAKGLQSTPSVFDKMELAKADPIGPIKDAGTDVLTGKPAGVDNMQAQSNSAPTAQTVEPAKVQTADLGTATKPDAVTPKATASDNTATKKIAAGPGAADTNATADQNVFSKLLGNVGDKTIAGVIQGAASGYSSARQAAAAAESRKINPSTLRGYTYRATA